jgi:heme exporter protein B
VAFLGAFGLTAIGTLLAAVAARTRYREVMLPLLLLPLLVPVILGAVRATAAVLAQQPLPWPPLRLLIVTDAVFLIVSVLCFEYVLDE